MRGARRLTLASLFVLALVVAARADQEAVKRLRAELGQAQGDADKMAAAIEKAAKSDDADTADAVLKIASQDEAAWQVRDAAMGVLRGFKSDAAQSFVALQCTKAGDARVRAIACTVAKSYGPDAALKGLVPALKDKDWVVQAAAVEGLAVVRKKEAVDALVAAYKDTAAGRLASDLQRALEGLTGEKAPKSASEWAGWWASAKEQFSFEKKADAPDAGGGPKTQVRSTPDGSGLYETISSNKVVFVVDVSGSMKVKSTTAEGQTLTRLEYVQKELAAAIEAQLGKKAFFNVIAFSDGVVPWKRKLVDASPGARKEAKEFVKRLEPKGETNAFDALEAAFADRSVDTIYFLTDGFPTTCGCKDQKHANTKEILGEVRRWNATRHVRLHCIAFVTGDGAKFNIVEDKGMAKDFMKRLAEENSGTLRVFE